MRGTCAQCGRERGNSPSDDFCGETCQWKWHRKRVDRSGTGGITVNIIVHEPASLELAGRRETEVRALRKALIRRAGERAG